MSASTTVIDALAYPARRLSRRSSRFLDAALFHRPRGPRWTTPNEVIAERDEARVREFTRRDCAPRQVTSLPIVVVPPEVNQSFIVDFGPGQSLVAALADAGLERVVALEWKPPTAETAGRDIDESLVAIREAIDAVGGRAHLLGVCQGGWESAIVTALYPERVATLTLVAAPIDFRAGEGLVKQVAGATPMSLYRSLVMLGGGVMRGELVSMGFDGFMAFERFFLKYLALWNHIDEPMWLARHHQLNDWYRSHKDLPGPLYLRAVRELFKENRLIEGRLTCLGRRVDLAAIACPLCLVVGERDHITPPVQLLAIRERVASGEIFEVRTPGGHIGAFMGRRELAEQWPLVFDWLRRQDAGLTKAS